MVSCAGAAWTGLMGLTFESNRPIESKSLHCPSGFLTGLRVKYGRTRQEDRDLYDFKLKCGNRWTSWSGLWFKNEVEDKTMECPSKMYVTGVEVKRGRNDWQDRDTYDFKLQCSGVWQSYMGMRSSSKVEVASAECPSGEGTSGIKVYRGFVEWGDKDLYECVPHAAVIRSCCCGGGAHAREGAARAHCSRRPAHVSAGTSSTASPSPPTSPRSAGCQT